ncbi:MAG TPA: C25 family cysteine peptidase [Gemmatales bacterium]|nr:C25 family cysteine peptidase [Gemmatales bacterium]
MRWLSLGAALLLGWSMPGAGANFEPRIADEPQAPLLAVIGPKEFLAELDDYLAHKAKQFPTRAVALEEILTTPTGCDDAETLKRWLYDQWRQGLRYALLVGDASVLPVRYMVLDRVTPEAFDYAFYPSDLYYGDVARADGSFDDWNAQKDGHHAGYFGEVRGEKNKSDPINFDNISYVPELAVGRWPAATPAEARRIAAKTVAYEQGLDAKPGRDRAAFFAVDGWVDSRGLLDRASERLGAAWSIEERYYGGQTPPPNEAELYRLLNEGLGLVVHAGHGETDRWDKAATLAGLRNKVRNEDRLPLMLSAGCSTAYFAPLGPYESYRDRTGETQKGTNAGQVFTTPPPPPHVYQTQRHHAGLGPWLVCGSPGGAVAYFGCNTGSQPCGLTLVEGFVGGLARQPRLGDAWIEAVQHYWERERLAELKPTASWYPASIFFQGMKFMLYGDPTLLVPGGKR